MLKPKHLTYNLQVEIVSRLTRCRAGTIYRLLRAARRQWLDSNPCAKIAMTKTTCAAFLPGSRQFIFNAVDTTQQMHRKVHARRHTVTTHESVDVCVERARFGITNRRLLQIRRMIGHAQRHGIHDETHLIWLAKRHLGATLMPVDRFRSLFMARTSRY